MLWKAILILLTLLALYLLARLIRAAVRFKRSLDELSIEAAQRLMRFSSEVDSTPQRWHEYDETYQQALASLEGNADDRPPTVSDGRGATLGPKGGSFLKPPTSNDLSRWPTSNLTG